jgi:hypothetical protein
MVFVKSIARNSDNLQGAHCLVNMKSQTKQTQTNKQGNTQMKSIYTLAFTFAIIAILFADKVMAEAIPAQY